MATKHLPQGCTNFKLRQLGRIMTRHYDRYLAAVGLKNTQYALLSHVVKLGPIRPSDLARRMQMDASTLTRNLQPMVAQGWLEIGEGEDARSRLVSATPLGQEVRTQGQRAWKDYTPYELRTIATFVRLGWRDRASELIAFFFADRRPAGNGIN